MVLGSVLISFFYTVFLTPLIEETSIFSPLNIVASFVKDFAHRCVGLLLGFVILFYWSIFLFL